MAGDRRAPLGLNLKLAYASGQLVEGVANNTLSVFLLFYVTAVCGLPGGLAGLALAVGLVVDAVMNPLIGSLTDGWRSRWGRRLPFMAASVAPITLCFVLIFTLPSGLSPVALAIWVALLSIALRLSMSVFILPYQALGAELTEDYVERSSLMTWRWLFGQLGAVAALALGFGVFLSGAAGLTQRSAYTPFAIVLAAIFLFGAAAAMRVTRTTLDRQHVATAATGQLHMRAFRELAEAFRNPSFRVPFLSALLFFTAMGAFLALGLHANTFFWQLDPGQTQAVTLGLFAGLVAGAPLAAPLLRRFEKAQILSAGMLGLALAQGAPAALRLLGLLPLSGAPLAAVLALTMFAGGSLMAAAAIALMSMIADATDQHEHLFGTRREGLYSAGQDFAMKAAQGLGSLLAGLVLQLIQFPAQLSEKGGLQAALPQETVDQLGLFYGPGTAMLSVGAALITLRYRLDRKAHASILQDLQARRVPSSAQPPASPQSDGVKTPQVEFP